MAPLLFICPKTNQQAPTGIETDVQSLSASWKAALKVNCPHCGAVHEISVRETYITVLYPANNTTPGVQAIFDPRLRRDARGRNGSIRQKLAAGMKVGQSVAIPEQCLLWSQRSRTAHDGTAWTGRRSV